MVHAPEPPSTRSATTLAGLLEVGELHLANLTLGLSLDVPVRWVHSTELRNPAPYLRGGELVCTVGSSIRRPGDARSFVDAVRDSGASGICFGIGDVHAGVPQALLEACVEDGLPLLAAPHGVPFMAIAEFVAEQRVHLEQAVHASDKDLLGDLLAGVRAGASVGTLLERAAAIGGLWQLEDGASLSLVAGTTDGGEPIMVSLGSGLRLTWTGTGKGPDAALLRAIVRLLDVCRHEADLGAAMRRERVGELLGLIADRLALPAAVEPALLDVALDANRLVCSAWPSGAGRLLASTLVEDGVVIGETVRSCVVVSGDTLAIEELAKRVGLPCGHSRVVPLADVALALREAQAALELAQRRGGVVKPGDLTTFEGLLVQQPSDRLEPFVDRLLEPILRSDRARGTQYLVTLRAYIDSGASLVDTARNQYLHVNTVRHRLQQIRELSGRDPFVLRDRVDLVIALWALDHRG